MIQCLKLTGIISWHFCLTNAHDPPSLVKQKPKDCAKLGKKSATLSANYTIVSGVTLGAFTFINAGAVAPLDLLIFGLMANSQPVGPAGSAFVAKSWNFRIGLRVRPDAVLQGCFIDW